MSKEQYPVNPTPEQIQEWQAKFGEVFKVHVGRETDWIDDPNYDEKNDPDGIGAEKIEVVTNEGYTAYLRIPSRQTIAFAQVARKTGADIKFNETLLNGCWLGGNPIIKTRDDLFLGVSAVLHELIDVKEAVLEKL